MRLISLVPSITATLCDLGLKEYIVGCTQFCIYPKSLRKSIPSVGGTKDANISKIRDLKPTHIFTNTEENTIDIIEKCKSIANTYECHPVCPHDIPNHINSIVKFLDNKGKPQRMIDSIRSQLQELTSQTHTKRFLYLIWKNPWMAAGQETYISNSLNLLGWENAVQEKNYPKLSENYLNTIDCDCIIFTSEPFPFRNRDIKPFFLTHPKKEFYKGDGQLFTWWGSFTSNLLGEMIKFTKNQKQYLLQDVKHLG